MSVSTERDFVDSVLTLEQAWLEDVKRFTHLSNFPRQHLESRHTSTTSRRH